MDNNSNSEDEGSLSESGNDSEADFQRSHMNHGEHITPSSVKGNASPLRKAGSCSPDFTNSYSDDDINEEVHGFKNNVSVDHSSSNILVTPTMPLLGLSPCDITDSCTLESRNEHFKDRVSYGWKKNILHDHSTSSLLHTLTSSDNYTEQFFQGPNYVHHSSRRTVNKIKSFNYNSMWACLCLVVALVLVMIVPNMISPPQPSSKDDIVDPQKLKLDNFFLKLRDLGSHFPQQTSRFWNTIKATVRRNFIDVEPKVPVVLLIGFSYNHTTNLTNCITYKLAEAVSYLYSNGSKHLHIDIMQYHNMSGDDAKLVIDEQVQFSFGTGNKVVVLHNIEYLHPDAAMLLHSYCDNVNALEKKVVFLLTSKYSIPSEKAIENDLENSWGSIINRDNLPALLSRIANNIIIVNSESNEIISKICPGRNLKKDSLLLK